MSLALTYPLTFLSPSTSLLLSSSIYPFVPQSEQQLKKEKEGRRFPIFSRNLSATNLSKPYSSITMASSSLSSLCLSKPVGGKLFSSFLFSNSSSLSFSSSNHNSSLHFFSDNLKPTFSFTSSAPKPLTVIAMAPPKPGGGKPKKVTGMIKLALEAGKATPAPPVGPALGSKGVNIMAFCKDYNARTADKAGYVIPVEITVYDDRSFTFILKTPPASVLLLKAAGAEKGSKDPKQEMVGKITIEQLRTIAQEKLPDLNCTTIESAMRIIAGTAANMGIEVDPPVLEPKQKEIL